MTLNLALAIKIDAAGMTSGGTVAKREIDTIGQGARNAERALQAMEAAARSAGAPSIPPAGRANFEAISTAAAAQVGALNASKAALAAHAGQTQLTAEQSRQLAYQMHDVVVSLAGGMNPLMVLLQQGSQITPLFGGIGGTMRALVGLINPVTAGIGGLTVATAAGALAWNSYLKSTLEVQTALSGLGRNSGATRLQLEAIAQSNAAAGGLTVTQARSIEAQLLRTGKVGVDSFAGVLRIARDFAATLSTDVDGAADKLGEILSDPGKGVQTLQQLGLLDGATARYIQRLGELGRTEEARKAILDRLPAQLASHREALAGWALLWDDATRAARGYVDAVGVAVKRRLSPPTDQERIAARETELRRRQDSEQSAGTSGLIGGLLFGAGRRNRVEVERLEAELGVERDYLRRKAEHEKADAERRREEALAQDRATTAVGVAKASPSNELAERRRQLSKEIEQLRLGLQAERLDVEPAEDAARRREIAAAIEAKKAALEGLRPVQERQAALDRVDAQIAMARDPVAKAALAALRERIALENQEMTTTERAQAIENARAKVLMDAISSSRTRIADMQDEARARSAVNDAIAAGRVNVTEMDRYMRTEQELRPLIIAHAKAEGAVKQELARIIEQLRQASAAGAREEARSNALQQIAGHKEKLETLRAEIALIGASEATRSRMLALLEAEHQIRRGNIDASSTEARQIRANAAAQATLTSEIERQKAAYSTLRSFGERQIDAIIDKIAEQGLSWQSMGDLAKSVLTDLNKEMMKLIIGNPLKNALFGSNLPTLTDAQGLFGMLGGKNEGAGAASIIAGVGARAVGSMTVTAASVIVNGGIGSTASGLMPGLASSASSAGNPLAAVQSLSDSAATNFLKSIAPGARADAITGLQPEYQKRLAAMVQDAQKQFGPSAVTITSGFRSVERQRELWDAALEKYGSPEIARKWVAPPGASRHNYGEAVDLQYGSPAAKAWMHENAGQYGLNYRLRNEDWHLEMDKAANPTQALASSAQAANDNLSALTSTANSANLGLDKFGSGLNDLGRAMNSVGGGGGVSLGGLSFGGAKPNASGIYFAGSSTGGLYHSGGMVGSGGLGRTVDWSVFAGAPKFHGGGLLSGERPIIAQVGEGIFTPRQMDTASSLLKAAMQPRSLKIEAPISALARGPDLKHAPASPNTRVTVINNGRPVSAEQKETRGADGSRDITIILDEMQAAHVSNTNAKTYQAIRKVHGTAPALAGRSR